MSIIITDSFRQLDSRWNSLSINPTYQTLSNNDRTIQPTAAAAGSLYYARSVFGIYRGTMTARVTVSGGPSGGLTDGKIAIGICDNASVLPYNGSLKVNSAVVWNYKSFAPVDYYYQYRDQSGAGNGGIGDSVASPPAVAATYDIVLSINDSDPNDADLVMTMTQDATWTRTFQGSSPPWFIFCGLEYDASANTQATLEVISYNT